jgi:hypothetical protein
MFPDLILETSQDVPEGLTQLDLDRLLSYQSTFAAVQRGGTPGRVKWLSPIDLWRATADEDGHYCFAMALRCFGQPSSTIGKSSTAYDLALRLKGGSLPDFTR